MRRPCSVCLSGLGDCVIVHVHAGSTNGTDCQQESAYNSNHIGCVHDVYLFQLLKPETHSKMTTDTSDLFMHHHQSCIIEELHEPEAQEPTSTQHTDVASEPAGASSSAGGPEQQQGDTVLLQQTSADADADAAAESQGDAAVAGPSDGATNDAAPSSSGAEQPVLTPEQQQLLEDCERLKQEGNAAYARGEYDEALQLYWQV